MRSVACVALIAPARGRASKTITNIMHTIAARFLWQPKWPWVKTKGIVPNSDDGYLAHGTALQGAGFLSLTPHLGALPPSHQDAPGKTLPAVNSNDPRTDVKWDERVAEFLSRYGTCCCGQIRARL
jgi:hypothetical protein